MSDIMKTIGRNLVRIRKEKGLTRTEVCSLVGIAEIALEKIEGGTADVDTEFVYKVIEVFGVELGDVICSAATRNKVLEQINRKLDSCSEKDLIIIFEYINTILKE